MGSPLDTQRATGTRRVSAATVCPSPGCASMCCDARACSSRQGAQVSASGSRVCCTLGPGPCLPAAAACHAAQQHATRIACLCGLQTKTRPQTDLPRTRAWNLRLRRPTPYPLGQQTTCWHIKRATSQRLALAGCICPLLHLDRRARGENSPRRKAARHPRGCPMGAPLLPTPPCRVLN